MNLNGRLQFQSAINEQSLEQEANEIASRIVEKVKQRSKFKSAQKEIQSQYLRASDYKSRQSIGTNQFSARKDMDGFVQGPQSETTRGKDFRVPEFRIINDKQPYELIHQNSQKSLENPKAFQKSSTLQQCFEVRSGFPQTVKMNQKNFNDVELTNGDQQNCNFTGSTSKRKGNLKIDNLTHTKSSLSIRTTQLQTPASIADTKQDIVSQLLGSLKQQKQLSAQNHFTKRY